MDLYEHKIELIPQDKKVEHLEGITKLTISLVKIYLNEAE